MSRNLLAVVALLAASCGSAQAAPEQWLEARSNHFTCLTDSNEKQGRHVLDQLERMRWVFETLFPKANVDPPEPIVVFAAKNVKTFQSLEPQSYLAKGQLNLAGYFLRTQEKNYILLRLDAEQEHPFATVYHEYTHLQFSSAAAWMPLWLNEGIAEFFQNTEIRDTNVLLGELNADDILYLRQQRLIPLPVLFKVDAGSPFYHEEQKGSVFYAESWALTHYLQIADHAKGTHAISDYMSLMSQHEDPVVAAEKAFGDLEQLQSALESYIQAGQYKQLVLNSAAAPLDEASYTFKTISQIEADVARAGILANVQREKEARDLLASILKADPNNVQARETLGFLEFRSGNQEAALKWYGEAVKHDSQNYLANYYFGAISMNSTQANQDSLVESSLHAAIKLNPKFAPAYDLLAAFYGMRNKDLDEALSLSNRAVELDPSNLQYRLNAVNVLTAMRRYSEAVTVLQSASNVARKAEDLTMIRDLIEQFQQEQAQIAAAEKQAQGSADMELSVTPPEDVPKHPTEASGPKHIAIGVIRHVTCSYPSALEFRLEGPRKTISVYSNDFSKIILSAVDIQTTGSMNPCKDFEGMKARIQYAETSDKTIDGQVSSIELRK